MKNKSAIKKLLKIVYFHDRTKAYWWGLEDSILDEFRIDVDSLLPYCAKEDLFDIVLWDLCGFVQDTMEDPQSGEKFPSDDHFSDVWNTFVVRFRHNENLIEIYKRYEWVNSVDNYIKFLEMEMQDPENFINKDDLWDREKNEWINIEDYLMEKKNAEQK